MPEWAVEGAGEGISARQRRILRGSLWPWFRDVVGRWDKGMYERNTGPERARNSCCKGVAADGGVGIWK